MLKLLIGGVPLHLDRAKCNSHTMCGPEMHHVVTHNAL